MGRRTKYHTEEERNEARRKQRLQRSLLPGAKEARRAENHKAYAKRVVIDVPEPSAVVRSLASEKIAEDSLFECLALHHSIANYPLILPTITLTDADFQKMAGLPPYPPYIVNLDSFETDWPQISAALQGYVTRQFVLEQKEFIKRATSQDRASLASELTKSYRILMEEWELFGNTVQDNPTELPTEFLAFQSRLWASRRLTWLADDLGSLVEGVDMLLAALKGRMLHF